MCGRAFFSLWGGWASVCKGNAAVLAAPMAPKPNNETEKIDNKIITKDERTEFFIALPILGRILQIKMNGVSVKPMGEELR